MTLTEAPPEASRATPARPSLAAVRQAMSDPMTRSSYALLANTAVTGGLGFLYWIVAARLFDKTAVGKAGALVSAFALISGLGMLNLSGTLMRFLPRSGGHSKALVGRIYAISIGTSAVLVALVLTAYELFASDGATLKLPLWEAIAFGVSVVGGAIFTLEDSVLIGIRRATVVPVENGGFGLAKIILLFAFAPLGTAFAVFSSWIVPLLFIVPVINGLIFWRFLPNRPSTLPRVSAKRQREVRRFVQGDVSGGIFQTAWIYTLPLIVTAKLGAADNARFYVALLFAITVDQLSSSFGSSLLVEGAHRPAELAKLVGATAKTTAKLTLPVVVLLAAWAPLVLRVYGGGYGSAGTIMRILVISMVPKSVLTIFESTCRVLRRTGLAAAVQGAACFGNIVAALLLARPAGLVGVAYGVLCVETVVAAGTAVWMLGLRSPERVARMGSAIS